MRHRIGDQSYGRLQHVDRLLAVAGDFHRQPESLQDPLSDLLVRTLSRSKDLDSMSSLCASILEKSRMSFMSPKRVWPADVGAEPCRWISPVEIPTRELRRWRSPADDLMV